MPCCLETSVDVSTASRFCLPWMWWKIFQKTLRRRFARGVLWTRSSSTRICTRSRRIFSRRARRGTFGLEGLLIDWRFR